MSAKTLALSGLILLGVGLLGVMAFMVWKDGALTGEEGGWVALAFLSLREVFGKIETVTLGREPRL